MKIEKILLTITEGGMVLYWVIALLVLFGLIYIPPEYMYSDHSNPLVVAWNWSFFPMDIIFSVVGLIGRFGSFSKERERFLFVFSLSLMFCAGIMAITYWAINGVFDPFWWGVNIWLLALSSWYLTSHFRGLNNK